MSWNPFSDEFAPPADQPNVELILTIPESDFIDKVIKQFRNNFKKVNFYDRSENDKPTPEVTGMDYYIYRKITFDPVTQTTSPIIAYQVFVELSSIHVVLKVVEKHYDGGRNISGRSWPVYEIPVEFTFLSGSQYFDDFQKLFKDIEVLQKQQLEQRRASLLADFLAPGEIVFDNPIEKIVEMHAAEEQKASTTGSKFGTQEPNIMDFSGKKEE